MQRAMERLGSNMIELFAEAHIFVLVMSTMIQLSKNLG